MGQSGVVDHPLKTQQQQRQFPIAGSTSRRLSRRQTRAARREVSPASPSVLLLSGEARRAEPIVKLAQGL